MYCWRVASIPPPTHATTTHIDPHRPIAGPAAAPLQPQARRRAGAHLQGARPLPAHARQGEGPPARALGEPPRRREARGGARHGGRVREGPGGGGAAVRDRRPAAPVPPVEAAHTHVVVREEEGRRSLVESIEFDVMHLFREGGEGETGMVGVLSATLSPSVVWRQRERCGRRHQRDNDISFTKKSKKLNVLFVCVDFPFVSPLLSSSFPRARERDITHP